MFLTLLMSTIKVSVYVFGSKVYSGGEFKPRPVWPPFFFFFSKLSNLPKVSNLQKTFNLFKESIFHYLVWRPAHLPISFLSTALFLLYLYLLLVISLFYKHLFNPFILSIDICAYLCITFKTIFMLFCGFKKLSNVSCKKWSPRMIQN